MTDHLNVSLVQTELIWGNVEDNLAHFSKLIADAKLKTDLLVLPEMFTSGFLMDKKEEIAPFEEISVNWMQEKASQLGAVVVGSIIVNDEGDFFNRLFVVNAKGLMGTYDKRHLFRMGEEQNHFKAGTERLIFEIGKWRICPLVCYDLRFPVWSRGNNDYDLLLYVANWPEARREVWNTLLKARAIENQAYTAGVNRIGADGMNLSYSGDSSLFDAKGKLLVKCEDHQSEIQTYSISLNDLNQFRDKFPVFLDADSFQIDK
ncbi:amidohydrolase [Marinifilum caeruleilacunae]|uniref:Amidohydrolase n=1 Tax=Marinifilum caeruleilacunae TaxID=2499076 RepID=A0ABX1WZ52_9BACT|nr:amidohydrolase [Marinifilum caeruleilacunae]NOU61428.1 amidohydrolase [Marinifilum caeruleilacunae]